LVYKAMVMNLGVPYKAGNSLTGHIMNGFLWTLLYGYLAGKLQS